ncbi:MAG TPA: PEPxxWA-CTERM sorting domain-containing protein [Caulobacteraceae bacterium]|jgi:hypothetical protein|nr:PEPxxWA-CTERM sorting domain-containing protein [Caulobacteraceae bacterium]
MKAILTTALAASLAAGSAFAAGFTGDTVDGAYHFPDTSTVVLDGGGAVAPTSFFFSTGLPNTTATVGATQITLSFDAGGGTFNPASFSGVVITDLTEADITGVTLDPSTSVPGFTASDLSFTSDSVSLNLQGLGVPSANDIVVADVSFGGVPEPASWALMLLGVGAVGGALRLSRRRDAVTA